jgi:replicative DNA helicase
MPAADVTPLLPAALEIERLVLGALITDAEAGDAIFAGVEPDDFSVEAHKRIFRAAEGLRVKGCGISHVSVAQALIDARQLESCGGLGYLAELDSVPRLFGVDSYLRTLREKAILRKAASAAEALTHKLCAAGAGVEEVREAEEFLRNLAARAERHAALMSIAEFLDKRGDIEDFLNPSRKAEGIVPSPWQGLNAMLSGGGLRPGQLVILAARPGLGKSACASAFALAAARAGCPVAFFSLEMSAEEIFQRMIASLAGVSLPRLLRGELSLVQRVEVQQALSALSELPLRVDDTCGATVPAVVGAVRRHNAREPRPAGLIVVDYLQLITSSRKRQTRAEEVSSITRDLKLAARDLRAPVLVLAQLNRDSERQEREPELHDLRESGSIEQDADVVMFLHRRGKRTQEFDPNEPTPLALLVRKQRNGPIGARELEFAGKFMRISERGG